MDRWHAMHTFARVVETGSFTRAAHSLQLSKTTVTQLVQQLEAHLRVQLLHRTTRRLQLTADGAHYHAQVVRLLADLQATEDSVSRAQGAVRGRLRVDVPSPLASHLIVPALPAFCAHYPEITLELGASDRHTDLLAEHVDCVVRAGTLTDAALVARRVGDLRWQLCAAPGYLTQTVPLQHPADLHTPAHRWLGFRSAQTGQLLDCTLQRGALQHRVAATPQVSLDDGNAYLAAALAGLGVACLPHYLAQPHLGTGQLQAVLADWHMPPMPLYVAYRPQPYVSAKLRAFIDWVVELMALHAPIQRPLAAAMAGSGAAAAPFAAPTSTQKP